MVPGCERFSGAGGALRLEVGEDAEGGAEGAALEDVGGRGAAEVGGAEGGAPKGPAPMTGVAFVRDTVGALELPCGLIDKGAGCKSGVNGTCWIVDGGAVTLGTPI